MDIDIIKRFICGAKQAYKKVDNHSFNFPITIEGAYRLATDIEELLKEQEARVLTLEEVEERMNTNDDYDSVFYAEVRTLKRTSFGVFHLFFDSKDYYVAMLLGCSFPAWYRKESYGHKWRCWSAKPTNEQRKAVKWE